MTYRSQDTPNEPTRTSNYVWIEHPDFCEYDSSASGWLNGTSSVGLFLQGSFLAQSKFILLKPRHTSAEHLTGGYKYLLAIPTHFTNVISGMAFLTLLLASPVSELKNGV